MRPINKTIIQMVDVANTSELINQHAEQGMPMVGFHFIVETDGEYVVGRHISIIGNHYLGDNASSIGIAALGKELTKKQESTIDILLEELESKAPNIKEVLLVESGELKKYK